MSSRVQLYAQSAEIIRDFLTGKGSIKNLCYANHIQNTKAIMALVYETLKYRHVLIDILCMAQVPGYRAYELARYAKLAKNKDAENATEKRDKRAMVNAKSDNFVDEDDENGSNSLFAQGSTLGISSSWHSCFINVNVPQALAKQIGRPEKIAKQSEMKKSLKVRYLREVMLVVAYDMIFGNGSGFDRIYNDRGTSNPVQNSVIHAVKLLNCSPATPYMNNTDVLEIVNYIEESTQKDDHDDISNILNKIKSSHSIAKKNAKILRKENKANGIKRSRNDFDAAGDDEPTQFPFKCLSYVPSASTSLLQRMESALVAIKIENKIYGKNGKPKNPSLSRSEENQLLLPITIRDIGVRKTPRYVRVNTLKTTLDKAIQLLTADGYIYLTSPPSQFVFSSDALENRNTKYASIENFHLANITYPSKNQAKKNSKKQVKEVVDSDDEDADEEEEEEDEEEEKSMDDEDDETTTTTTTPASKVFWSDPFIQNLIAFMPNEISILTNPMVTTTCELIIQDKSSCMPPVALSPIPGQGDVIDTCAAPGNKTSLLSALMENQGNLFAIELNARRAERLTARLQAVGASNAQVLNTSFFDLNPTDPKFKNVKYILLDPSCSGSGNPSLDTVLATGGIHDSESEHVRSLSDLQVALVSHALKFPAVEKIVYSTCSIYARENEGVVTRLIPVAESVNFTPFPVLPKWPARGWKSFPTEQLDGMAVEGTEALSTTILTNAKPYHPIATFTRAPRFADDQQRKKRKGNNGGEQLNEKMAENHVHFKHNELVARVYPDIHFTGGFFVSGFQKK